MQTETRRFSADEMIACEKCSRANPPTRVNCLYCGATLPSNDASATMRRPVIRPFEEWERGFNVISLPAGNAQVSLANLKEAAVFLSLEEELLRELLAANRALPLARVATVEEATLSQGRLNTLGLNVEIIADEALLGEDSLPKRIKRVELADDALRVWTGVDNNAHVISWGEIVLLVRGRIFTKRVEIEEKRTRRGREKEMVDARELVDDVMALDIFEKTSENYWRIVADNFDYSCLKKRKGLLAKDNFETLVKILRERAPSAEFDDDYSRARPFLAAMWPLAERTQTRGLKRARPGKFNTEAVTLVSNEMQFRRYGRLVWKVMSGK